jgi:hypothetical protein
MFSVSDCPKQQATESACAGLLPQLVTLSKALAGLTDAAATAFEELSCLGLCWCSDGQHSLSVVCVVRTSIMHCFQQYLLSRLTPSVRKRAPEPDLSQRAVGGDRKAYLW